MGVEFKIVREKPEDRPDVAVFRLAGWLDTQSEERLVEAVQQAKDEGAAYVLLDFRALDTITSAGVRALQRSYQILTPRAEAGKPGRLKLCNTPPQIYQVLSVTGMLINIPTYESQDIALDSFGT